MNGYVTAAVVAVLAAATGGCQTGQDNASAQNKDMRNSQVYIGALSCNVSGSSGYLIGSTKDLGCVYTTKEGGVQAYDGKIRKFGLDLGTTKAGHMIWKVYQVSGLVGGSISSDPRIVAGEYVGEDASIAAGSSAGGNWLYGGSNKQIVLQATQLQDTGDAGYNLAYGIAAISLSPKN
jgi:hypothetical protein